MGIYRKIRQIREIVEYRRCVLFILRRKPLSKQSGSPNDIDQLVLLITDACHHVINRPIHTFRYQRYGLQKCCMKPEQPLFSLVPAPAQSTAYRTRSQIFEQQDTLLAVQGLGYLGGKEISVTNFNFLLRISIHSKKGYLNEFKKNDRLQENDLIIYQIIPNQFLNEIYKDQFRE